MVYRLWSEEFNNDEKTKSPVVVQSMRQDVSEVPICSRSGSILGELPAFSLHRDPEEG